MESIHLKKVHFTLLIPYKYTFKIFVKINELLSTIKNPKYDKLVNIDSFQSIDQKYKISILFLTIFKHYPIKENNLI